jgi:transposase-like protein
LAGARHNGVMSRLCTVCAHLRRAEIDQRLAFQVVNVSALARELGVSETTVRRHREKHLPQFLAAFQASASALTLGALQAEAQRLYVLTLDALAKAEAGVLVDVSRDGEQVREVSHTAIARFIKEARQGLGLLAKLSADAGVENERPAGIADGELSARISAALEGTMARTTQRNDARTIDAINALSIDSNAVECIEGGLPRRGDPATTTPGPTSSDGHWCVRARPAPKSSQAVRSEAAAKSP